MAARDMVMVQLRIPLEPFLASRSPFAQTTRTTVVLQALNDGAKVLETQQAEKVAEELREMDEGESEWDADERRLKAAKKELR
jgi:hypothetical protein